MTRTEVVTMAVAEVAEAVITAAGDMLQTDAQTAHPFCFNKEGGLCEQNAIFCNVYIFKSFFEISVDIDAQS